MLTCKGQLSLFQCVSAFEGDAMLQYLHTYVNSESVMEGNSLFPQIFVKEIL